MRNVPATSHPIIDTPGIGPKKTFFVLVTVVGCIAILWPKVFYPMLLGGGIPKQPSIKGHHGTGLRQERPPHLRKEGIHPAMLEKGRAIPSTQTVPVVSRPAKMPPIMVEGRPGPIPGLRPPLGAGSVHKAQPKSNSMSFIMPLYTIGIIAFFVYTIMKLLFKKPVANAPYGAARSDPNFRKEVFENDEVRFNRPDDGTTKLGSNCQQMNANCNCGDMHVNGVISSSASSSNLYHTEKEQCRNNYSANNETQLICEQNYERDQLMEIEKLRKKLEDTEHAMAKLISEMGCDPCKAKDSVDTPQSNSNLVNGTAVTKTSKYEDETPVNNSKAGEEHDSDPSQEMLDNEREIEKIPQAGKSHDHNERTVQVLGMEMTASCEGGLKWSRPPTPIFAHRPQSPSEGRLEKAEEIYLQGALPRESQILIADAETRTENVTDDSLNGSPDEPAVVLSSKMTLSLINLSSGDSAESGSHESDSPIGEDIEIINGSERENELDNPEEEK